jgi:predicted MPP superfamily phosphohydrolase
MRLLVLHLSDFHFDGGGANPIIYESEHVINAALGHAPGADACLIVATGDFINKGDVKGFEWAGVFLDDLRTYALKFNPDLIWLGEVLVPGNHDVHLPELPEDAFSHRSAIENLRELKVLDAECVPLAIALKAQSDYLAFDRGRTHKLGTEKMWWTREFSVGESMIEILCINSSALAFDKNDFGKLRALIPNLDENKGNSLRIVAIHHPFNWLAPDNARALERFVTGYADVVLSGHEHEGTNFVKHKDGSAETLYFLADAIGESPKSSGFATILFDLSSRQRTTTTFIRGNTHYNVQREMPWMPIRREIGAAADGFVVSENFIEVLDDPGFATETNRGVRMQDVYVFPRLQSISFETKGAKTGTSKHGPKTKTSDSPLEAVTNVQAVPGNNPNLEVVSSSMSLADELEDGSRVFIVGDHRAGKTTLLQQVFLRLRERGFVPLIVGMRDLGQGDIDKMEKGILKKVEQQYGASNVERYIQLPLSKRAILVDDFESTAGSLKEYRLLLDSLKKKSGITLVTGDESLVLRQIMAAIASPELLGFKFYRIQTLDPKQQREMAAKVHDALADIDGSQEDCAYLNEIEKQLELILGNGTVRPLPGEVKSILRDIIRNQHQGTEFGAYGFHYDRMIKQDLSVGISSVNKDVSEPLMDVVQTFLTEFAFDLYVHGEIEAGEERMTDLHKKFSTERFAISQDRLLEVLRISDLVVKRDDAYRFRERYQRYYFLASKFKEMIVADATRAEAREMLSNLVSSLDKLESAEVVLFTIYLTNDPWLLGKVQQHAANVLGDQMPCDMETCFGFAYLKDEENKKTSAGTSKRKKEQPISSNIDLWIDSDGEIAESSDVGGAQKDSEEERELRLNTTITRMNEAFNTLNIIGQAVRNYPAKLTMPLREQLVEEVYFLGLRACSEFNDLIREERQELHMLSSRYLKVHGKSHQDLFQTRVDMMASQLVAMCGFGVVRRITNAVASPHIQDTLIKVGSNDPRVSVNIIRSSVLLDLRKRSPQELAKFFRDLEGNFVARSILQNVVANHLRTFRAKDNRRTALASAVGIDPDNPRFFSSPFKPRSIGKS